MKRQNRLQVIVMFAILGSGVSAQERPVPLPRSNQSTETRPARTQSEQKPEDDNSTQEATEIRPSTSGRLARPEDPNAAELRQAQTLQAQWLSRDASLKADLEDLPACSEDATRLLAEVRDAAFSSFAAFGIYYQKSLALRQQRRHDAEQRGVDRIADRNEIQTLLGQAEQELASAQQRKQGLGASLAGQIRTEGGEAAIRRLDAVIARTGAEVAKLRDGLKAFDEGGAYLREIRDLARDQERMAADQLTLVRSESMLWKAVYDSRGFREQLRCHRALPDIHVYDSPSQGGIR